MSATWGELFIEHDGYVVDKWQQYPDIYQNTVGPLAAQEEPVSFLEIGVQNGGALEIWAKFLPFGSRIVGLDINADVEKLSFDNSKIKVHVVDATDREAVESLLGDDSFDLVIDDGSHRSIDIISSFEILFPHVKPGGVYIIEDLHASYSPAFGGGYAAPASAISYLKNIIDGLHVDYMDMNLFSDEDRVRLEGFRREIGSITFHDSVAVIRKLGTVRNGPYVRMLSGTQANVVPISQLAGSSATHATAIHLLHETGDQKRKASQWWQSDLQKQINECRSRISSLERQIEQARRTALDQNRAHSRTDD